MCLKVSSRKLTAKTDLLVFKCLDSFDTIGGRIYCTPFQYKQVIFKKGINILEGGYNALTIEDRISKNEPKIVKYGVHAFTIKKAAIELAREFNKNNGTKMYYAVIPKGTKYYLGNESDIVAEKIIIFRSKRNFDTYAKKHKVYGTLLSIDFN